MQLATKRIGAAVLVACLLAALVLGGAVALAAPGAWWNGGGNTLTVKATNTEAFEVDIASADVVVDVVKIADAAASDTDEAFDYTFTDDFSELSLPSSPTAEDWETLAAAAAEKANLTADGTASAGERMANLGDGLYLVLAHGKGVTTSLTAESELHAYTFSPVVVALPSKQADEDGAIRTDGAYGEWLASVEIALKPEQTPRYGSLRIDKTIADFSGEPATFVFHLRGTTPANEPYDNYAAITYSGGTSADTVVTHIPVGTRLTVTEVYSGARYELSSGDDAVKVIVADSDVEAGRATIAAVAFANSANGSGKGGHGIENNFTYDGDDWPWTATPSQGSDAS